MCLGGFGASEIWCASVNLSSLACSSCLSFEEALGVATAAGAMMTSPSHTVCGCQILSSSYETHHGRVSSSLSAQKGLRSHVANLSLSPRTSHTSHQRASQLNLRQTRRVAATSGDNQVVEESEDGKVEPASLDSTSNPAPAGETPSPSPFTAGKISLRIAAKTTPQSSENGRNSSSSNSALTASSSSSISTKLPSAIKPQSNSNNLSSLDPVSAPRPSVFTATPTPKPSFSVKPKSLIDDGSQGAFPTGKVSPFAADRLKSQMASPPSQYNRTSSGRTMIKSGKQVLEAFKQGEVTGKTTKFGQPIVPKNIFDDVKRTPQEMEDDKFKFSLKPGDIFLIFSFVLIIGLMLGTAFLVWKVGAIHYNE